MECYQEPLNERICQLTSNETRCDKLEFTNIILDSEFKELVYKVIKYAQDTKSMFYLSKLFTFEIYHDELKEYFKVNYNKKPTQTDNLAFILLLSYPKFMVERFQTFKDLKLAFNSDTNESDFKDIGFKINEEYGFGLTTYTCICNEPLMYIHVFQNVHSGINIQLGSICNERYGLISKYDPNYKSVCKKINECKENIKERKDGLPQGFYENERKRKREEKRVESHKKEIEKELNKMNKKLPGTYSTSNCINCNAYTIYKLSEKINICRICISFEQKEKKSNIITQIKKINRDCFYCEKVFISIYGNNLCITCEKIVKIKDCIMCFNKFCLGIKNDDIYCDICEENIIKCITCKKMIYKNINLLGRCSDCYQRYINKLILIECEYCEDEFEVSENQKWRICCPNCYKNNLESHKCEKCSTHFKRLPHETWRKVCSNCYSKR